MPSARRTPPLSRRLPRLALIGICGLLALGTVTGCSTTQEKAARAQARAKHLLQARAQRQRHKQHGADGHKSGSGGVKSAQRKGKEG